jgi:hypothetical protein
MRLVPAISFGCIIAGAVLTAVLPKFGWLGVAMILAGFALGVWHACRTQDDF